MWYSMRGRVSTDDAFIEATVVQVSPQISGRIARVPVADNQFVKAGDLLAALDTADLEMALKAAEATRAAAAARVGLARSEFEAAEARLRAADAQVTAAAVATRNALLDLERYQTLSDSAAISAQTVDNARLALERAQAQEESARQAQHAAQAELAAVQSRIAAAEAEVRIEEVRVENARLNLSYARITAPCDGRVTRKSVEPGNYVRTGQPLMALVGTQPWVVANFKESQLAGIRPGQRVTIRVDAYPDLRLTGRVDSIQRGTGARFSLLPPENATGNYVKIVQRVPVKIVFDPPPQPQVAADFLAPGLSVVPTVHLR
jgi:membrane fusion protein (multidrug efflux system)